ncbi:DUF6035 family protein [Marinigracilibium pacificum]|uniref:Competence protein CoiA-like protein n=1 Tax=Marinigracilibium pacificum TaxID=2729599 RepID=A0A848J3M3_9BACT|nr:DUF6035 family protein [Marinigracilibium pacificum]NMM50336.1 hypothetical protein [Marinigracilibium pacificum]
MSILNYKLVESRTIDEVLDINSGKKIDVSLILKGEDQRHQLREKLQKAFINKDPWLVCPYCKQPLNLLASESNKKIVHFGHFKSSNIDCYLKSSNNFTKKEIERIKYNGVKEGEKHIELKTKLYNILKKQKNVSNLELEKVYRDKETSKRWKRPDVQCQLLIKSERLHIAFELQLSTTFLSVIVDRQEFYKKNQVFIFWVFHSFNKIYNDRAFTKSDVFYNNGENAFILNEEAIKKSNQENELYLTCVFKKHIVENGDYKGEWKEKLINVSKLKFDHSTYKVYYRNITKEKKRIEKSELYQRLLKTGGLDEIAMIIKDNPLEKEDINILQDLYSYHINDRECISQDEWELNIVWALILSKLNQYEIEQVLRKGANNRQELKTILFQVLGLQLNKVLYRRYKNLKQDLDSVIRGRPQYFEIYLKAFQKHHPELFKEKKIKDQILKFRKSKNTPQITLYNDIIGKFF